MRFIKTIVLLIGFTGGSLVSYKLGVLEYDLIVRQVIMQAIAIITTSILIK